MLFRSLILENRSWQLWDMPRLSMYIQRQEEWSLSHKQACRDLGVDPVQLRRWKKDVDKIRSLYKGSRKGKVSYSAQFPEMEA